MNLNLYAGLFLPTLFWPTKLTVHHPKTQAALLEAMQERSVTAAGQKYELDKPFFVLATQNPIEQEGTYPLPEAQLDRFMFSIWLDYPKFQDELTIVQNTTSDFSVQLNEIISKEENPVFSGSGAEGSGERKCTEVCRWFIG